MTEKPKAGYLPFFDSVADAERMIKRIITDRLDEIDTLEVQPSPAGEIRLRYRRTHTGPRAFTTITLRTEHE